MQLKTAIPCVQYDDFLTLTLPHNLPLLDSVTVVTSPRDAATIKLATQLGVDVFATDAWHEGGPLNKARALNEWWTQTVATEPEAWLMTLDADILLFDSISAGLRDLDPRCLYGACRRMCHDEASLRDFLTGSRPLSSFPLDTIPVIEGRLWGKFPQGNPAGLAGFLQLWCPAHSPGLPCFPLNGTAEAYDIFFGLSFPEQSRRLLPIQEALHLGPPVMNWAGRQSPRWHSA